MATMIIIGLVLVLLISAGCYDYRARSRGHRLRSSSDISANERDIHRNIRASRGTGFNPVDKDWNKTDEQRGFRG